jgi:hypothetical protein
MTNFRHDPQLGRRLSQRLLFFLHEAQAYKTGSVSISIVGDFLLRLFPPCGGEFG